MPCSRRQNHGNESVHQPKCDGYSKTLQIEFSFNGLVLESATFCWELCHRPSFFKTLAFPDQRLVAASAPAESRRQATAQASARSRHRRFLDRLRFCRACLRFLDFYIITMIPTISNRFLLFLLASFFLPLAVLNAQPKIENCALSLAVRFAWQGGDGMQSGLRLILGVSPDRPWGRCVFRGTPQA